MHYATCQVMQLISQVSIPAPPPEPEPEEEEEEGGFDFVEGGDGGE